MATAAAAIKDSVPLGVLRLLACTLQMWVLMEDGLDLEAVDSVLGRGVSGSGKLPSLSHRDESCSLP